MPEVPIRYIDEAGLAGKRVLLRTDFNVSLHPDHTIADAERIERSLPTMRMLLEAKNRLIVVTHLGRPKGPDAALSLAPVAERLREAFPQHRVTLVKDFRTAEDVFTAQKEDEILLLENIRFHREEKANDPAFARALADLADVYVNDAFANSHRSDASMVGVPALLPSYGGLLLKKEITMLRKVTEEAEHPVVAILGGAKVSTKIGLIGRLTEIADTLLIGGALANTFLKAQGRNVGKSFYEEEGVPLAVALLEAAKKHNTRIILPSDAVVGMDKDAQVGTVRDVGRIGTEEAIYDIGPETEAEFGMEIAHARTVVWNGPVGLSENPTFRRGTDFIYYSIAENAGTTIVGGGDTLSAVSKKEHLENITHVSTGGGAMLEFIEKGTLPAIEALRKP